MHQEAREAAEILGGSFLKVCFNRGGLVFFLMLRMLAIAS